MRERHARGVLGLFAITLALPQLADLAVTRQRSWHEVLLVAVIAGVLWRPRSVWPLVALSALDLAHFSLVPFAAQPVHEYIAVLIHCTVLAGAVAAGVTDEGAPSAATVVSVIQRPLRVIAFGLFFAGFVKLNRDFLDPDISCGGVYYLWLREWPGLSLLPTGRWAKAIAIGLTVGLELGGPLLLLHRRTRKVGLLFCWSAMFGICAVPRAIYYTFAGLFFSCSLFWLEGDENAQVARRLVALGRRASLTLWRLARWPANVRRFRAAIKLALIVGLLALVLVTAGKARLSWEMFFWRVMGLVVIASCTVAMVQTWRRQTAERGPMSVAPSEPPASTKREPMARALRLAVWLPALLFVANESCNYLGLPHRTALRMASNAEVRVSGPNHFLISPRLHFPVVAENVVILESNVPTLPRGHYMPMVLFRHRLVGQPQALVRFEVGGVERKITSPAESERWASRSLLVPFLGLGSSPPIRQRYYCEKAEPGKSKQRTRRDMRARVKRRGDQP